MKQIKLFPFFIFLISLLLVGCGGQATVAALDTSNDAPQSETVANTSVSEEGTITCAPTQGETTSIESAKLYVEYNATDDDLGVHGAFDDSGWSELCLYAPDGTLVLAVKPQSQLQDLAMAGIFFESREPFITEISFADLKSEFPEGQYTIRAASYDGTALDGSATFSHNVPVRPTIIFPALVEDEENAAEATVPIVDLSVEWADVTETVGGDPITITAYEVIITKVEHDDPHGFSRPIFDVHVPADLNTLAVPVEFLEPGTVYELELLALEESGNQTITVGFFKTEG